MKPKKKLLKTTLTTEEWLNSLKMPTPHKNKKKYNRKQKHKKLQLVEEITEEEVQEEVEELTEQVEEAVAEAEKLEKNFLKIFKN